MICPTCLTRLRVIRSNETSDGSSERICEGYCCECGEKQTYGVTTDTIINDCEIIVRKTERLITGIPT